MNYRYSYTNCASSAKTYLITAILIAVAGCSDSGSGSNQFQGADIPNLGAAFPAINGERYVSETDPNFTASVRDTGQVTLEWLVNDAEEYEIYRRNLGNVRLSSRNVTKKDVEETCRDAEIFDDGTGTSVAPPDYDYVGTAPSNVFVDNEIDQPSTYRYIVVAVRSNTPEIVASDLTVSIEQVTDFDTPVTDANSLSVAEQNSNAVSPVLVNTSEDISLPEPNSVVEGANTEEPKTEEAEEAQAALEELEAQAALEELEAQAALEEQEAQAALEELEAQAALEEQEAQAALEEQEAQAALEEQEAQAALEEQEAVTADPSSKCPTSPSTPVVLTDGLADQTDGADPIEPPDTETSEVVNTSGLPDTNGVSTKNTELLAFPGAMGFGRNASGGRGGRVVVVNTLDNVVNENDGKTSLREALEVLKGPRIVTFAVGGIFDTGSEFIVMAGSDAGDLTVACQTAPEPGVVIKGTGLRFTNGSSNVIMRHCTFRNVDPGRPTSEASRAISVIGSKEAVHDMIFDHLSMSWSTDENWTVFMNPTSTENSGRISLTNSIVSEGDSDSTHSESGQLPDRYLHSMGPSCNSASKTYRINDCSIISNLIAHNGRRNPLMWGVSGELIDNRIYNWQETALDARPHENGLMQMQVIGNEFREGPTTKQQNNPVKVLGSSPNADFRVVDNVIVDYPSGEIQNVANRSDGNPKPASTTGNFNLNCVGASRPSRDAIDSRVVSEYENMTGQVGIFSSHQRDFSIYSSGSWGSDYDQDMDGMADDWEIAVGLDPRNSEDFSGDLDNDGYTNLEEFINAKAVCN